MAVTVYWACLEKEWIKANEPEKVIARFHKRGIKHEDINDLNAINQCPVFNSSLKNIYAIKSIYDYSFNIVENGCTSSYYDQDFFNNHVVVRSLEKKFFSFFVQYIFFTEEDDLEMSAYQYPIFEENKITERCIMIPGKFNIGKYFRNLEFPFILKKDFNEFIVNQEDVMYYLQFHTNKNIKFKQFIMNEDLLKIMSDVRKVNHFSKNIKTNSIDIFYNKFKGKKYILNKIKENLLD